MNNSINSLTGIRAHVFSYIKTLGNLNGKTVLDIPSGDGWATNLFKEQGAKVISLDIFPRSVESYTSQYGDMGKKLNIEDNSVDIIICQEGIEHVSDQFSLLKEFNRILKKEGELIITTPNISNIRSKISNLFTESDMWKRMPYTEIDSIWHIENTSKTFYFGHLFLLPVNHLKTLLALNGFGDFIYKRTKISRSSVFLGLFLYPFYLILNIIAYMTSMKKNQHIDSSVKKLILWDRCLLNLSFTTLFYKHIFWVCKKKHNLDKVIDNIAKMQNKMPSEMSSEREIKK
jgi:SAM-dependent methyltransferase